MDPFRKPHGLPGLPGLDQDPRPTMPVWSLEEVGYTYDAPHIYPDGRFEGGSHPPEYYKYDDDLDGGTWEEGLQAIEDFDWDGTCEKNNDQEMPDSEECSQGLEVVESFDASPQGERQTNKHHSTVSGNLPVLQTLSESTQMQTSTAPSENFSDRHQLDNTDAARDVHTITEAVSAPPRSFTPIFDAGSFSMDTVFETGHSGANIPALSLQEDYPPGPAMPDMHHRTIANAVDAYNQHSEANVPRDDDFSLIDEDMTMMTLDHESHLFNPYSSPWPATDQPYPDLSGSTNGLLVLRYDQLQAQESAGPSQETNAPEPVRAESTYPAAGPSSAAAQQAPVADNLTPPDSFMEGYVESRFGAPGQSSLSSMPAEGAWDDKQPQQSQYWGPTDLRADPTYTGLYHSGSSLHAQQMPSIPTDIKNPYLEATEANEVDMLPTSSNANDEQPKHSTPESQEYDSVSDPKGKKPVAKQPRQEEPIVQAGEHHLLLPILPTNTSSLLDTDHSELRHQTQPPKPATLNIDDSSTQLNTSPSFGTVPESSGSGSVPTSFERHPFDLGYGKRHTRSDSKYEAAKMSSLSANPAVKKADTTNSRKIEGTNPSLADMDEADDVASVLAPGYARKKRKVEVRVPKNENGSSPTLSTTPGPAEQPSSLSKRKTTGKLQSKNTSRDSETPSASTATPAASKASSKANSAKGKNARPAPTPNPTSAKGKGKAKDAPNSNRKSSEPSSAAEVTQEEPEDGLGKEQERTSTTSGASSSISRPTTRRSSAQALELQKKKEKQLNIALRLRSRNSEGNADGKA